MDETLLKQLQLAKNASRYDEYQNKNKEYSIREKISCVFINAYT